MKPVVSHLGGKGLSSVIYLDDFLFFGTTFEDCLYNVQTSIKLLQWLGFVISYEKSCLIPSKTCNLLGFTFISETLTLELPSNKREKIGSLIEIFLKKKSSTIREFSQLIGSLISCCPAIPYGMGCTKALERAKFQALLLSDGDYDKYMLIQKSLRPNLIWFRQNIHLSRRPIRQFVFEKEIFSDASKSG